MDHYSVIPNEQAGDRLAAIMGKYAATYDGDLFTAMARLAGPQYPHGLWELREFSNGAMAMVLTSQEQVVIPNYSDLCDETLSLEAASLVANCIVLSSNCMKAFEAGDESANERFHDLYHALRHAIAGVMNFRIADTGIAEPTEEDLQLPRAKHPESEVINRLLN